MDTDRVGIFDTLPLMTPAETNDWLGLEADSECASGGEHVIPERGARCRWCDYMPEDDDDDCCDGTGWTGNPRVICTDHFVSNKY